MTTTGRTPLRERILPDYSRGEELLNMITHIIGGAVGLLILIGSILIAAGTIILPLDKCYSIRLTLR